MGTLSLFLMGVPYTYTPPAPDRISTTLADWRMSFLICGEPFPFFEDCDSAQAANNATRILAARDGYFYPFPIRWVRLSFPHDRHGIWSFLPLPFSFKVSLLPFSSGCLDLDGCALPTRSFFFCFLPLCVFSCRCCPCLRRLFSARVNTKIFFFFFFTFSFCRRRSRTEGADFCLSALPAASPVAGVVTS